MESTDGRLGLRSLTPFVPSPSATLGSDRRPAKETVNTSDPQIGFYYPGPMWYRSEAIKNLLLFFDGVSLLVPSYMENRPEELNPELVIPLKEQGLLRILNPEQHVDQEATEQLATVMVDIITSGVLDRLATDGKTRFHELSRSRLGYYGDSGLAQMLLDELKQRGLARDTEDGVSIPLHPLVRGLVLVLLAQILRPQGRSIGLDLLPVTDRADLVDSLVELLDLPDMASAGRVVSMDLETVGVDLSTVPLDEVLGFRSQYASAYRAYARDVRSCVRDLSQLGRDQAKEALTDRQEKLSDLANDLRRLSRTSWKKPATWGMSAAGAVWAAATGDLLSLVLAGAKAAISGSDPQIQVEAFSYLFSVPRRIGG